MEVKGLGGHGAYPGGGRSALDIGWELVRESRKIVASLRPHPLFVPSLALMWGKMEGGDSSYIIPERCSLQCAFPFPPPYMLEEVKDIILGLEKRYPVAIAIEDENPAWEIGLQEEVVRRLERAVVEVTHKRPVYAGMPSWTDATYLFGKGLKSVVFGAGDLALAHSPREGVSIEELERLAGIFLSFLG